MVRMAGGVANLWGLEDLLAPATEAAPINGSFRPIGMKREGWSTAAPIRDVFKTAFAAAGLPYANRRSLKKTLARSKTLGRGRGSWWVDLLSKLKQA